MEKGEEKNKLIIQKNVGFIPMDGPSETNYFLTCFDGFYRKVVTATDTTCATNMDWNR